MTTNFETPIRCGVVGLGRIGWAYHAQEIIKHPGFTLAAVCDLEQSRLEEAHQLTGCATYTGFPELIGDANVELVIVASQSIDHEPMTLAALEAGKHVLCEKPAALNATGVARMNAAAQNAQRIFSVHHNYRLNSEFLYVREQIQSGVLGQIQRIKRRNQSFSRRNDWQVLRKYGGGMTGNWGIHLVDQCLCLLDSPIRDVWGDVKQIFNPGDAEDDIKAIIRGESGMTLDIDMSSACAAPEPTWVVSGNHGTLWITGNKAHLKFFDPGELPALEVQDGHLAAGRKYGVTSGSVEIPWQEREEPTVPSGTYAGFYDNLLDAIREQKELLVTPQSALQTYEILDLIRKGSAFEPVR